MPLIYGTGPPEDKNYQHAVSQGEAMRRTADGGRNHIVLGHWFIVMVYEYWETRHRAAIAAGLGVDRDDVTVPVMGDLRRLRHAFLHEEAEIQPAVADSLEVLTFIQGSEVLTLSSTEIDLVVDRITEGVFEVLQEAGIDTAAETPPSEPD